MNKVPLHEHLSAKEKETLVALLVLSLSESRVKDTLDREYSIEVATKVSVILGSPTE